jgi:hypothetical protein
VITSVFYKGLTINSNAVDRILERVWAFSAKEEWERADSLLDKLIVAKPWDRKLLLTKAHLRKRKWMASNRKDYDLLLDTIRHFSRCSLLTGSAEAGINTATLLLISGKEDEAYKRAAETARHCRNLILSGDSDLDGNYAAIIAEANLIRGRLEAAESWYEAASSKDSSIADIFKQNMSLLLEHSALESNTVLKLRNALGA